MSLNRNKVNPLSVLGLRKLNFIPEHFTKVSINKVIDVSLIDNWINYNLNSRYAVTKNLAVDPSKKMIEIIEIGLEDPKEVTMLTLGCPYLHNN
jgi:hypothetical protein